MSDDLDDLDELLTDWLRDRGAPDRSALDALAGQIAGFPARRRRRSFVPLAAAAAIVVAAGFAALSIGVVPRQSGPAGRPSGPVPPDPAAFAGDARLARCGATIDSALDVFEMVHARDYHLHLPAMLLAPELDVDAPAFVVVFRAMQSFPGGAPPPPGQTWPPRSLAPGQHDLCVLVGADPATAEMNIYDDVDITGLTVSIVAVAATEKPEPTGGLASDRSSGTTPEPAPAWVVGLSGQLECNGDVANLGSEVPETAGTDPMGETAAAALATFLGPTNPYASLPAAGFSQLHADAHWASYGHLVGGRLKAVIVLTDISDVGPGWVVRGVRACDASEFDPAVPLTFPVIIWTDMAGNRVSTQIVSSNAGPAHCGWETAMFLRLGGDLYFRDPKGVMAAWTTTTFDPTARLPRNAEDSGYRSGSAALWSVPGGDAYVVRPDRIERWPRSTDPLIGCM